MNQHMRYLNLTEVMALANDNPLRLIASDFMAGFLAKPHFELERAGHNGNVCPYTQHVLKQETVHFHEAHVCARNLNASQKIKEGLTQNHIPAFLDLLEPRIPEKHRRLACLVIVYPLISKSGECDLLISGTQKELQPICVSQGLLLSELHPYSLVPSARQPGFFPSRPPLPIHFLRRLIPFDIPYILRRDRYDEATFNNMLDSLIRIFDQETIKKQMARLGKTSLLPPDLQLSQPVQGEVYAEK